VSIDAERPVRQAVGREGELSRLASFLAGAGTARAFVLEGAPGSGKTTLWEAAIARARERGLRVLAARPSGTEAALSFAALTDLLEEVDLTALRDLPEPQRHSLEVALLRVKPAGPGLEPRAIATGLLNALRALAATAPLVVAIDDVPWLDRASADTLVFAARRLGDCDVRFLLARRPGAASALETAFADREETLAIRALSIGAIRRLLFDRLVYSPPRPVLQRLYDTAGGNPLFALELGRALVEQGTPEIGADMPLPDAVEDLLQIRLANLPRDQRRLLAAVALSPGVTMPQMLELVCRETLEGTVEAGVIVVDGDRVRAAHPLLAAAARKRTRAADRRTLHRELADVEPNESLRARHLTLATVGPDAELAGTVSAAAQAASSRGARREAVELADHALRLTPPDDSERVERVLALSAYLEMAGELQRLTSLLTAELPGLPSGSARARAWLILSEGAGVKSVADYREHLEHALAEARDDPALRARIVAKMSSAVIAVERIPEAEAQLVDVLPAARRAGPDVERPVLFALAWARALGGERVDDLCERFTAASDAPWHLAESPERVAGQRLVWRGQVDEARRLLDRLLADAEERGEPVSYAWARLHLCELALRTGDWDAAQRRLDEWAETGDDFIVMPLYQRCRALLAAGRGDAGAAERWAAEAIIKAEAMKTQWDWLEAMRARGVAALLTHDHARAAESLGVVWEHAEREGVGDPGAFPVAPDLVEALAGLGRDDDARLVADRLSVLAAQHEHPWGRATAQRVSGDLAAAATAYAELGLHFDEARTLLTLGRGERREKRWGAARRALEQARMIFEEIGSPGWAAETQSELDRVKGRRPSAGTLTPAEERVARLAADGLSNKEIAAALFVSVNTVEAHLSHVYAKLVVRSRGRLAGHPALAEPPVID
jgi:DNA-binding CsgD family transcriptional regulator